MKARTAARELALLILFQLETTHAQGIAGASAELDKAPLDGSSGLEAILLGAVRTLTDDVQEQLKETVIQLQSVGQVLLDTEIDHPDNLDSHVDAVVKPVTLPNTQEMGEYVQKVLESAEVIFEALRLPELLLLSHKAEVKNYALGLCRLTIKHVTLLDKHLNEASTDWRIERLNKMDRSILRMAAAEMVFEEDVDHSVSINEAVELAKLFSTDEGYKFINGVLGQFATQVKGIREEIAQSTPPSSPNPAPNVTTLG